MINKCKVCKAHIGNGVPFVDGMCFSCAAKKYEEISKCCGCGHCTGTCSSCSKKCNE